MIYSIKGEIPEAVFKTSAVRNLKDNRLIKLETRRAAFNYWAQLRDTCGQKIVLTKCSTMLPWSPRGAFDIALHKLRISFSFYNYIADLIV